MIAQSLQAKGERELSGWLTEQSGSGGENAFGLNRQTLFFQGKLGTEDGERRIARGGSQWVPGRDMPGV